MQIGVARAAGDGDAQARRAGGNGDLEEGLAGLGIIEAFIAESSGKARD
ncbi:MAG: hypothetical protein R2748_15240 [Bryobacterales bacterium]